MDLSNLSNMINPTILIPVLAGLGTIAFVVAIGFIANRRTSSAESRLELFTRKGKSSAGSSQSIEIWKDAAMQGDRNTFLDSLIPNLPSLEKLFQQADVTIRPSAVALLSVVLGVLGIVIAWIFTANVILSVLPGIALFSIPWVWVFQQRKKRLKSFQQQMPDAMELLARALRAGQSLQAGLHIISEEMPPPVATEFGRVYEEQNLGVSLEDALKSLCERVPNLDLRFFVTSVLIQRQTGGDLAEILDKIGYVIRERFKIQGAVQALTGEGRLSGVVLIALPFVMFLVVCYLNYDYAQVLWTTDKGKRWCIYAVIMQIMGALLIRKIVNIKV